MTEPHPLTQDLAQRIKAAREAAGLPQTELAKRLKVSLRTLQCWEAGAAFPQYRHRARLAAWLEKHERQVAA